MIDELPRGLDPKTRQPYPERFADAQEVKEVCDAMIHSDNTRSQRRARVQGIIDGNLPYRPGLLQKNAQGWRANVNFREAEGLIQAQRTPYYDLIVEVQPCIEVECDYGKGVQKTDWETIIASEFHRMLFDWDSFDWHIQMQQNEMLVHGVGTHVWLSKLGFQPRTLRTEKVLFTDGTTSDLSDLEFFVVRDSLKTHQLWNHIRNPKSATTMGWNTDVVKQAIIDASNTTTTTHNSFEYYQQQLKNGDMGHGYNRAKEIHLNHVFVQEFEGGKDGEGGISHYIITENAQEPEYLFESRNRFDSFSEVLCIFPYDIGSDGTIHSVRGLGPRMAPFMELSNRLKNHMVDQVLVGSGILLSQKGNPDIQKAQLTKVGPLSILPQGFAVEPSKLQDLAQGPLALTRELQQTLMENTKTYRQGVDNAQSHPRTAFEVNINAQDSAKLNKGAHNMYYRQLTKFYREMIRRAVKGNDPQSKDFVKACKDAGVPSEALAQIVHVEAIRSLGAGSASQRLLVTQQLMQTLYPLNESNKANILRDWTAAVTDYSKVGRYIIDKDTPTNDDAIAVLENDALLAGSEALVVPSQNHYKHATIHLLKAQTLVQALDQGQGNPEQIMGQFDAIGAHTAAHLHYLQQDPTQKANYAKLHEEWTALSKMNDQLRKHVYQQRDQAAAAALDQQGQQIDPELALKAQKQAADIQMKQNKTQIDLGIKQTKANQQLQINDAMTASKIRNMPKPANAS